MEEISNETVGYTMNFSRIIMVGIAAFLLAACQAPALDDIQFPEQQETVAVPQRATIPFSLEVKTEATRVSYEENTYSFKTGDKLHVQGVTRTDIEGDLTQNGNVWSGELSYSTSEDEPGDDTQLEITLIHADNADVGTYASALVGSVPAGTTLLQNAVENYSLFTAQVTLGDGSASPAKQVTLSQQAAFLDVTVTFNFDGSRTVEAGKALVDLTTTRGKTTAETDFIPLENNEDFEMHFMAVVPGGKTLDAISLAISDRPIVFENNDREIECNKKYTIKRTIDYRPQLGDPFWSDGTYGRLRHSNSNVSIVGIIVYVNHDKTEIGNALTESNAGYGHGLVMALKNAAQGVPWSESIETQCTSPSINNPKGTTAVASLSGYSNTNSIVSVLEGVVSAASLAKAYSASVSNEYTSGWFLPSIGQWMYTISTEGFGGANPSDQWINGDHKLWLKNGSLSNLIYVMDNNNASENLLVKSLNSRLELLQNEFGVDYDAFGMSNGNDYADNYWSSSESDLKADNKNTAIRMNFGSVETYDGKDWATIKVSPVAKDATWAWKKYFIMKVRPFLAF